MAQTFIAGSAQFLAGASTTIATPGALNIALGDTVVVGVRMASNAFWVTGVTDGTNVLHHVGQVPLSGVSGVPYEIWICDNCAAVASATFTATFNTSSTNRGINATQWRSCSALSSLDTLSRFVTGAANITTAAITTAQANEVVITLGQINSLTSTWTATSGWTEAIRDASNVMFTQYKVVAAIQTGLTVAMVNDTIADKNAFALSLRATGGGGECSAVF